MDTNEIIGLVIKVVIILVLVCLSQTFTGLNIGLMSLDTSQLQVLIEVPKKDEEAVKVAKYAKKILPLRQKGNLLLCTILLGNTAVNALMSIILGEFAGGAVGFAASTVIIVLLCEIVPQSICTRHGLLLGALGSPLIRVAMFLFYPITKPYAIVLDILFPMRENMLDRSQLRALVEYQNAAAPGMLANGQAEMLIGALGVAKETAATVMIPMDQVFKICLDDRLEHQFVGTVVQKGFSRFPVVDSNTGKVEGLLHCKDLLIQRFRGNTSSGASPPAWSDETTFRRSETTLGQTARDLLKDLKQQGRGREVFICGKNTTLMSLLSEFKTRPHLAVVADAEEPGEVSVSCEHIGIVTLHNIFETILQAPVGFTEGSVTSPRQLHRQAGAVRLLDRRRLAAMAAKAQQLGEDEAEAVLSFLVTTQKAFAKSLILEEELLRLLCELQPQLVGRREELYSRGQMPSYVTLVLQGAIRVTSGEDQYESTVGPWGLLGMQRLSQKDYVCDFTAVAVTDGCLVLKIHYERYLRALEISQVLRVDRLRNGYAGQGQ